MKLPEESRYFSVILMALVVSFGAFALILSAYNLMKVRELRKEFDLCKSHMDELDEVSDPFYFIIYPPADCTNANKIYGDSNFWKIIFLVIKCFSVGVLNIKRPSEKRKK